MLELYGQLCANYSGPEDVTIMKISIHVILTYLITIVTMIVRVLEYIWVASFCKACAENSIEIVIWLRFVC